MNGVTFQWWELLLTFATVGVLGVCWDRICDRWSYRRSLRRSR